jgi:arylsulfatase A-like enzyme
MTPGQVLGSSALGATIGCGNRNEAGCRLRGPLGWYELIGRKPADQVRQRFLHWLDDVEEGRPFFAFLNLFDAHAPYLPPTPFDTAFARPLPRENPMHFDREGWEWTPARVQAEQNAYDGAIAYIDQQLGLLFDELSERGRLANTLVIVTSDHGEEFMEHGVMTHGNSLYAPALHVPLLLALPGRVPEGRRFDAPVSIRDLPATVCDLVGVRADFPGESLARFWTDGTAATDSARVAAGNGRVGGRVAPDRAGPPTAASGASDVPMSDVAGLPQSPIHADVSGRTFRPSHYPVSRGDMQSVIDGRWHYIRRGDGHEELYDMAGDPWERTDRLSAQRTVADSLARMLPRRGAHSSGGGQP